MNKAFSIRILSVDPGKSGALVLCDWSRGFSEVSINKYVMPLLKNGKDYNIHAIKTIISGSEPDLIIIEDVHAIAGSSAGSMFQFGFGVGLIRGLAETSGRPYQLVSPKTWQKEAWQGIRRVKNTKLNSQAAAHRLFPQVDFRASSRSKNDHDGIIDALLINYYGFLKFKK